MDDIKTVFTPTILETDTGITETVVGSKQEEGGPE